MGKRMPLNRNFAACQPRPPEEQGSAGASPSRRAPAEAVSAVCSRIAYSDQKRPWCSYLLPAGEGAPQGRMRAELLALARKSPHPAVPATFSPREKERRPRRACNSMVKRAKMKQTDLPLLLLHVELSLPRPRRRSKVQIGCGPPGWRLQVTRESCASTPL